MHDEWRWSFPFAPDKFAEIQQLFRLFWHSMVWPAGQLVMLHHEASVVLEQEFFFNLTRSGYEDILISLFPLSRSAYSASLKTVRFGTWRRRLWTVVACSPAESTRNISSCDFPRNSSAWQWTRRSPAAPSARSRGRCSPWVPAWRWILWRNLRPAKRKTG